MRDQKETRMWVENLREQTVQVGQNLIRENEKLRALALAVEAENARLQEQITETCSIVAGQRELRVQIAELSRDRARLGARIRELEAEAKQERNERARMAEQIVDIERESEECCEQYSLVMRQHANLSGLYVASYMLHSTLDRDEVLSGIGQILVNLVGSEHFAIFERNGDELRVVASRGIPHNASTVLPFASDPIGTIVRGGQVQILDPEQHFMHAVIPLAIGTHITGAIVIFELLPQKTALDEGDRELFEMLSAHAATALYCASLHERSREEARAAS